MSKPENGPAGADQPRAMAAPMPARDASDVDELGEQMKGMKPTFGVFVILAMSSLMACNKAPQQQQPERLYRVDHANASAPVNFVHKTFKVPGYVKFEFEVPPHSVSPKLQGTFKAFASGKPDEPASVDVLLLTPEQFADFTKEQGEATYSATGSSGQTVDYALAPTIEEAQKYYLVFRNPAKGSARTVEADFTASF